MCVRERDMHDVFDLQKLCRKLKIKYHDNNNNAMETTRRSFTSILVSLFCDGWPVSLVWNRLSILAEFAAMK
jgi:hypothetical protein